MYRRKLTWTERGRLWTRLGIRLVLAVLAVLFAWKALPPLLSLLAPFVAALIVAALLNPLVRFFQRKLGWNRRLLSLLLLLLIVALLGGAVSLLVYYGGGELLSLAQNWQELLTTFQRSADRLEVLFARLLSLVPEQVTEATRDLGERGMEWLTGNVSVLAARAVSYLRDMAMGVPAFLLALVVFVMAAYFLTADYPYLRTRCAQHMDDGVLDFLRRVRETAGAAFGGYLRAEVLLSAGVFLILGAGFYITRQKYGLLLALGLAVLDFIPIIGSGTVLVPWAVAALFTENYSTAIALMLIWGVVVVFRRVAEPKIVGNQTGLSPILSLVSIYVGMKLAGVTGMILGPILTLVVLNLAGIGMFHGVRLDLSAAAEDLAAILRERPGQE